MQPIPRTHSKKKRRPRRPRWAGGERVTRKTFMDDGTWLDKGDACLANSPLKHGVVVRRLPELHDGLVLVKWDDGSEGKYLDHGVNPE